MSTLEEKKIQAILKVEALFQGYVDYESCQVVVALVTRALVNKWTHGFKTAYFSSTQCPAKWQEAKTKLNQDLDNHLAVIAPMFGFKNYRLIEYASTGTLKTQIIHELEKTWDLDLNLTEIGETHV